VTTVKDADASNNRHNTLMNSCNIYGNMQLLWSRGCQFRLTFSKVIIAS